MTKKRSSSSRARSDRSLRRRLLGLLPSAEARVGLRRGFLCASVLVAAVAIVWTSWRVRNQVLRGERFCLDSWEREFKGLPAWVTPEIEAQIHSIDLADSEGRLNLLQKGVLRRLRTILEASPWILSADEVALRSPTSGRPGSISARLEMRPPVAIVSVDGYHYLADAEGRRLGEPYDEAPRDWFGIPVIRGAREPAAVAAPGEEWQAADIREGIAVASILYREGIHEEYPDWPIEVIDVSNVRGRLRPRDSEIVLVCGGRSLEWGRSPLSLDSRTVSIPRLLENLRDVLGRMDERPFKRAKLCYPRIVIENS